MSRFCVFCVTVALWLSEAQAQTPAPPSPPPPPPTVVPIASLVGPNQATVGEPVFFDLSACTSATPVELDQAVAPFPVEVTLSYDTTGKQVMFAKVIFDRPGSYVLAVIATGTVKPRAYAFKTVVCSTPAPPPPPVPPTPPTPPPTPDPPKPDVVGNLRVLMLYESSGAMTQEQRYTFYSTAKLLPYLNDKCLKDTQGVPSWRFWDKDVNLSKETPEWTDAMAKAKADAKALPKVVVFAGNTLVGSRTIKDETDTLTYLQSFGGK